MSNVIYEEAKTRIPNQREKIVSALKSAGDKGIYNSDLAKICVRWYSRIQELYVMGYKVDVDNLGKGICKYTLVEEPTTIKEKPANANDIIIDCINKDFNGSIKSDELLALLERNSFRVTRKAGFYK